MSERRNRGEKKERGKRQPGLPVMIAISVFFLLALAATGTYAGLSQAVERQVIPARTYVDGVNIGGMTAADADALITQNAQDKIDAFQITISGMGVSETWYAGDVGIESDASEIVAQTAYPGFSESAAGSWEAFASLRSGSSYQSSVSMDASRVRELVRELADSIYQAPSDASAAFDKAGEAFSYMPETYGQALDVEAVVQEIAAQFNADELAPINVKLDAYVGGLSPEVTEAELRENTVLVGECVTETTSNEDRNVNIRLMCEAADGICLKPGEQLSLNDLVGERTEEKGFRYAGAIVDGKIVDDMGGGICQMAGTLYNAALYADIEIVERVRHTYPSTYLPIGLDATLNWDNKDLVIGNNTSYPIYISTKFTDNKVTARIYGRPLEDGITIRLRSEVIKETKSGSAQLIMTNDLPEGQRKTKQSALNGYEAQVYKEYWRDDTLLYEQMISHDRYQPRNAIILIGSGSDK